jgi:hypothetical protein
MAQQDESLGRGPIVTIASTHGLAAGSDGSLTRHPRVLAVVPIYVGQDGLLET